MLVLGGHPCALGSGIVLFYGSPAFVWAAVALMPGGAVIRFVLALLLLGAVLLVGLFGFRHVLVIRGGGITYLSTFLGLPFWGARWPLDPEIGSWDFNWEGGEVIELPGGIEIYTPDDTASGLLEDIRAAARVAGR